MNEIPLNFKQRVSQLKQMAHDKKIGNLLPSIPIESLPALDNYLGGFQRGTIIGITADTNVGKTPLMKFLLYGIYLATLKNPKIKARVMFFALEETIEEIMDSFIQTAYLLKYNTYLDPQQLISVSKGNLKNEEWARIDSLLDDLTGLESFLKIIDNLYHPTGIFKCIENNLKPKGYLEQHERKFKYIDPSIQYFIFIDNVNLFRSDAKEDKHKLIELWTSVYCITKLSKYYNCTVINALQQFIDPDKEQYNNKTGKVVVKRLEPSISGLGNNRETARDHHILLGLFAPSFYDIDQYYSYTLIEGKDTASEAKPLGYEYRALIILKNRRGKPKGRIDLYLCKSTFMFLKIPPQNINNLRNPEYDAFLKKIKDFDIYDKITVAETTKNEDLPF